MKFYRKAEEAANRIIQAFEAGDVPQALAAVFVHRRDESPCRKWSWNNQLLAALFGHSDARGFRQWQEVGRNVRKGQKAFPILAPCMRSVKKTEDDGRETKRQVLYGFTSVAVFGLSQTEGEPIVVDPEVAAWLESLPLGDVARSWGLEVDAFNGERGGYLGYYKHGEAIALGVKNLATWAHELVHAADDQGKQIVKRRGQEPSNEIVAELGGAVLLEILGHEVEADRGGAWSYIKSYAKLADIEPITACQRLLTRTCDAVALILDTAETLRAEEREEVAA